MTNEVDVSPFGFISRERGKRLHHLSSVFLSVFQSDCHCAYYKRSTLYSSCRKATHWFVAPLNLGSVQSILNFSYQTISITLFVSLPPPPPPPPNLSHSPPLSLSLTFFSQFNHNTQVCWLFFHQCLHRPFLSGTVSIIFIRFALPFNSHRAIRQPSSVLFCHTWLRSLQQTNWWQLLSVVSSEDRSMPRLPVSARAKVHALCNGSWAWRVLLEVPQGQTCPPKKQIQR